VSADAYAGHDREEPAALDQITHEGGCHCGNLRWQFGTGQPLAAFSPRACDCDFCTRQCAAWISDPHGVLRIHSRDAAGPRRYRQGSRQAEFLSCATCGVLVAVVARAADGRLLGAANRNSFDHRDEFGASVVASPQQLEAQAKRSRWSTLWTPVEMDGPDAADPGGS
jgi:hypothetical protein